MEGNKFRSNFEISIEQTAIMSTKLMNSQIEILSEENRKGLINLKLIDFLVVTKNFIVWAGNKNMAESKDLKKD